MNTYEGPCAVCARLTLRKELSDCAASDLPLSCLDRSGELVTRETRCHDQQSTRALEGHILYPGGVRTVGDSIVLMICKECLGPLRRKQMPRHALANGRWLGECPPELQGLRYVEQLLIARNRHSFCVAQVSVGKQRYMTANAIIFGQPVARMYNVLPPPRKDIEECLAILFVGTAQPTNEDVRRTPFLVRHRVVMRALEWLRLNHPDYYHINISLDNMQEYPEDEPPVGVVYRVRDTATGENLAVNQTEIEHAVESGDCSFVVHGLCGSEFTNMTYDQKVRYAVRYFDTGGKAMYYGHERKPQSIYHNPTLFPSMFPWLFPYGLGGFENEFMVKRLTRGEHIKALLLYPDRRFERDRCFAFIAFNHEQIRASASGGYLMTTRNNFASVADKILALDRTALDNILERGKDGDYVRPENDAEKACFDLISVVDHVAGHVSGLNTSRKYQRNEIKSLIMAKGMPIFFVTFAPADLKNPLCLYYCGENIDLFDSLPRLRNADDRRRAIADHPAGAARSFDFLVKTFIRVILRYDQPADGLFGPTEAYYGTVEAQGRLTLHLHMLVWIQGCPSPQEVRDRLLADPEFEGQLLSWLEACHAGDFSSGNEQSLSELLEDEYFERDADGDMVRRARLKPAARDPATILTPRPPPPTADAAAMDAWHEQFLADSDRVVFCMNRHVREHNLGCWRGYCRARFPREVFESTQVDRASGAIRFAKSEQRINPFNRLLSHMLRSNTDLTCLLSGTQVKAIVAYVTDYVTKSSLTTHGFFETVRTVLAQNTELLNCDNAQRGEAARALVVKIVNALSGAAELGGPAVCSYLLGNPDHYTSAVFKVFHWRSYMRKVLEDVADDSQAAAQSVAEAGPGDRIMLGISEGGVVSLTKVNDYVFRPEFFSDWTLCDFLSMTDVKKLGKNEGFVGGRRAAEDDNMDVDSDEYSDSEDDIDRDEPANGNFKPETKVRPRAYRFISSHPFRKTHGVYLRPERSAYVLNFVGGAPPRPDRGDREMYCSTMLALFRTGGWRTGVDLRGDHEPWNAAFESARFHPAHVQVMKNMNLLYECLDARDDFSANRRAEQEEGMSRSPHISPSTSYEDELPDERVDYSCEHTEHTLLDLVEESAMGPRTARNQMEMERMRKLLQNPTVTQRVFEVEYVPTNLELPRQSAMQWKKLVADARQSAVDRMNGIISESLETGSGIEKPAASRRGVSNREDNGRVAVVSQEDLQRRSGSDRVPRPLQDAHTSLLHDTIASFTLNEEQTRAFSMAARYLHHHETSQLLMYLGGMGGTGKSRVLLAIMSFLDNRSESHRFIVLGPTGSSAALVGGSTYHSVLGFSPNAQPEKALSTALEKIRGRLVRVDLVFLDEVSMISCSDLLKIHKQLLRAFPESLLPFGGKSMILAGDFAQLPPAGQSPSLYSDAVSAFSPGLTSKQQEYALGKAIWHQFTTVVILRQNMRQRGMSEGDLRFKRARENMRYSCCSAEDVELLRTRISRPSDGDTLLCEPRFQSVSTITARNAHRDAINSVRSLEFAHARGIPLVSFVSVDTWGQGKDSSPVRKAQRQYNDVVDPVRSSNSIGRNMQEILWNLPPTFTDHHAGILSLCKGMPILLKYNEATELCATNGAEAVVVDWHSHKVSGNRQVLDTLFVELTNPPRPTQLPGLPRNVIPLTRTKKTVQCTLPMEDTQVSVSREQVMVLPNFAMTDYASQGRTRTINVVHLKHCKNHQSIYTCLSRSSSLEGTVILDSFDASKIRGRASMALRREFRELELLDEITRLQLADSLPLSVRGTTRGALLRSFQAWKGARFVPSQVHPALNWANSPKSELTVEQDTDANLYLTSPSQKRFAGTEEKAKAPTSEPVVAASRKRPRAAEQWDARPKKKQRPKVTAAYDADSSAVAVPAIAASIRHGVVWDNTNWSCAYDSLLTILLNICADSDGDWLSSVCPDNAYMDTIRENMPADLAEPGAIESMRDALRDPLSSQDPGRFPRYGPALAAVSDVVSTLFRCPIPFASSTMACNACSMETQPVVDMAQSYVWYLTPSAFRTHFPMQNSLTTSEYIDCLLTVGIQAHCATCRSLNPVRTGLHDAPPLIAIETTPSIAVRPEGTIRIPVDGIERTWRLGGVIYHGFNHFTCRYIDKAGQMWYHDGDVTKNVYIRDSDILHSTTSAVMARTRSATHFIYVLTQ